MESVWIFIFCFFTFLLIIACCLLSVLFLPNIRRYDVFEWFNSKNEFIDFHNYLHDEAKIKSLILDD